MMNDVDFEDVECIKSIYSGLDQIHKGEAQASRIRYSDIINGYTL